MALRIPTIDDNGLLPPEMEARLAAPLINKADLVDGKVPISQLPPASLLSDANVAPLINGATTGAAIDARINTQVKPQVQKITAEYIASDRTVADAAAAAVNAAPKIVQLETVTIPKALTDAKTHADTEVAKDRARLKMIESGVEIGAGVNLDEGSAPGTYYQQFAANATPEKGYPVNKAGVYEVKQWSPGGGALKEEYWPYGHEGFFFRHVYYGARVWKEVPTKTAVAAMIDAAIPPSVGSSSRTAVVAIGDSLTDGFSNGAFWPTADKWPTVLGGLLPKVTVLEYGVAGYTTDATMLYIGAHKPRFTIPGGVIPATGATVPITTNEKLGLQPASVAIGGKLGGVNGTLTWTGSAWTFNSLGGASGSNLTGPQDFTATRTGTWETSTAIIWLGRNDVSNATTGMEATVPDHVVASTKKLVEKLTPRVKNIMICGVTTRTGEESGSAQHAWVTEINDRLRSIYPEYFHSAQAYLRERALVDQGITPTPADTAKLAAGTIPPSVMDDDTHISKATAAAMARNFFQPFLKGKGYVD